MAFEWFKNKSYLAQIVLIIILIYAVSSIVVLGLALGLFSFLPYYTRLDPFVCVFYAIFSFVVTAGVSAFHLSTMIRRRKRRSDREEDEKKAAAGAKNPA
ncbi:MAG: hypothetical protein LBG84_09575 [Treponema sp.]|jgi:membrane protein implicated in regulation of membrane protease activity|nr:hypothetical protein [Treponema sp.]